VPGRIEKRKGKGKTKKEKKKKEKEKVFVRLRVAAKDKITISSGRPEQKKESIPTASSLIANTLITLRY